MTTRQSRRRSSGGKWVAVVLTLAIGFFVSRGFIQRYRKTYPPNAFYQVKRTDMLISIAEEGALRALNETVVRSGLEGVNRVIHLVPEGSYVEKGDLLVELDASGLKDRLNEQELLYQDRLFQMAQAEGNLKIQKSLAESQIKDGELKVENAQSDLEKYRDGDAPLLIRTVEARTGVLAEQVRIADERYARTQELFKSGKATRSEVEADALSLKREQLGLEQYHEDLRLIKKFDQPNQVRLLESKVEQAKAEFNRLKQRTSNEIAQAEADLKTSQGAVEVLEQGLKTLRARLEKTKILAPQNGLVVYAAVSPFQNFGEERRRDEGRSRGPRMGGRGEEGIVEFRGGGRRGGRSSLESSSGESSRPATTAQTVASGNQRIASAISGSSVTQPNAVGAGAGAGTGNTGAGGGNASSGGERSSGSSAGGQTATSAAGAFASYPSMRASSAFGGSSTATNSATSSTGSSASSSLVSTGGSSRAEGAFSLANQFGFRSSSSQNFRDFGGFDFYGTPGFLEEGTMVRQRQELIRLPDVSKMLAEVKIEEARVAQVRAGMTAYIHVKNIPHRRFKGTVRRIALLPDSQSSWMNPNVKVFPTDILVDEELPILKPGVSASAEIIITNLLKVLSVPIQTVARLHGENVCFVKKGSRVRPIPVATGWFNDSFVEITAGLREGDMVLLAAVGDEEIEETKAGETNEVEAATTSRPAQPVERTPGEDRRYERRNGDASPEGVAPQERRRNREGSGRRPRNAEGATE